MLSVFRCWFYILLYFIAFFAVFSAMFAFRGATIWLQIAAIIVRIHFVFYSRKVRWSVRESKVRGSGYPSAVSCYMGAQMSQSCVSARWSHADVTTKFKSKYKLLLVGLTMLFTAQIFVLLYRSQAMHFTCSSTLCYYCSPSLYADSDVMLLKPIRSKKVR